MNTLSADDPLAGTEHTLAAIRHCDDARAVGKNHYLRAVGKSLGRRHSQLPIAPRRIGNEYLGGIIRRSGRTVRIRVLRDIGRRCGVSAASILPGVILLLRRFLDLLRFTYYRWMIRNNPFLGRTSPFPFCRSLFDDAESILCIQFHRDRDFTFHVGHDLGV